MDTLGLEPQVPVSSQFTKPGITSSKWQGGFSLFRSSLLKVAVMGMLLWGCGMQGAYREDHELANLNVVFLDQQSLHKEWKARTGQPSVKFVASHGQAISPVKTLQGFFDFTTNTLYCPKWNFEVCGHELHHAVLGHFHEPH
jgi:hypothetical protein